MVTHNMGRNWLLGLTLTEVEETMNSICVLEMIVMLYMNYYMGGNGLLVQVMVSLSFSMTQRKVIFLRHRCFASLEHYQKKSFPNLHYLLFSNPCFAFHG